MKTKLQPVHVNTLRAEASEISAQVTRLLQAMRAAPPQERPNLYRSPRAEVLHELIEAFQQAVARTEVRNQRELRQMNALVHRLDDAVVRLTDGASEIHPMVVAATDAGDLVKGKAISGKEIVQQLIGLAKKSKLNNGVKTCFAGQWYVAYKGDGEKDVWARSLELNRGPESNELWAARSALRLRADALQAKATKA